MRKQELLNLLAQVPDDADVMMPDGYGDYVYKCAVVERLDDESGFGWQPLTPGRPLWVFRGKDS